MGSVEKVAAYRKRLNCKTIHFVEGNHDKVTRKSQSVFASWSSAFGNLLDEPLSLSMDVGVDSHDFSPWRFEEVQAIMKAKTTAREQSSETRAISG